MDNSIFDSLLEKYLLETITEAESLQLFTLLEQPEYQELFVSKVRLDLETEAFGDAGDGSLTERIRQRLEERRRIEREQPDQSPVVRPSIFTRFRRIAAAAAMLALVAGGYWMLHQPPERPVVAGQKAPQDILPGKDGALLTLADGTVINLDSATDGKITSQGNAHLVKVNGQLSYTASDNGGTGPEKGQGTLYNTIHTPPGHQLQLNLSDGSRVWLNASSSIRFPAAFPGGERMVELTGEGYFEVAKNTSMPFRIQVADMQIQVLGTAFNVMAYEDERAMQTTLLEGAVKVLQSGRSAVLKPGDQVQAPVKGQTGDLTVLHDADTEEAVAWKNGVFLLKGVEVATVLRQIGRWYDVEIVYKGGIPRGHLMGDIPRSMSLSHVMEGLQQFGIHTELEGRKLVVTP